MDDLEPEEQLELDTPGYLDWAALAARYDREGEKEHQAYRRRHFETHGHHLSFGCCAFDPPVLGE